MGPELKAVIKKFAFESSPVILVFSILLVTNIALWVVLNLTVDKLAITLWPLLGILISIMSMFAFVYFCGVLPDINEARYKDLRNKNVELKAPKRNEAN